MNVAEELEARFEYLASIGKNWVSRGPQRLGESCILFDYHNLGCKTVLSAKTVRFLEDFTQDYANIRCVWFNDTHDRTEKIWWLEEAVADAKERAL